MAWVPIGLGFLILVWTGDTDGVVAGTCYEMASWEHHPLFGFGLGHLWVEIQNGWGNPAGPKGKCIILYGR